MIVARQGLDKVSAQPAQSNIFFRQLSARASFAMPPCKDFVAEFSSTLIGTNASKRQSKTARTLASMAVADSIGVGRAPEIEQSVAALVVLPDKALWGNVQCPSTQCGCTDSVMRKAYDSAAYITHSENTVCQLYLATSGTLKSAKDDPSVSQFL